jgi:hypothetical protein
MDWKLEVCTMHSNKPYAVADSTGKTAQISNTIYADDGTYTQAAHSTYALTTRTTAKYGTSIQHTGKCHTPHGTATSETPTDTTGRGGTVLWMHRTRDKNKEVARTVVNVVI